MAGFGLAGAAESFVPEGFTAAVLESGLAGGFTADEPDGGSPLGETLPALFIAEVESVRAFGAAVVKGAGA